MSLPLIYTQREREIEGEEKGRLRQCALTAKDVEVSISFHLKKKKQNNQKNERSKSHVCNLAVSVNYFPKAR